MSDMSLFTCITCGVAFKNADIQRQHYKSDWHRYNLKRKVAGFPCVTAVDFQALVLSQREIDNEKPKAMHCNVCRKTFNGQNTFENHMISKKHKDNAEINDGVKEVVSERRFEKRQRQVPTDDNTWENNEEMEWETDSDGSTVDGSEGESDDIEEIEPDNPIKKNNCLFCPHHSRNMTNNLKHMAEAHTFFVPDLEYCVDLKGLLLYCGSKVRYGNFCLWCGGLEKRFASFHAAQQHMLAKGHCQIQTEGDSLLEYAEYYDYSKSYPDAGDHEPDDEVELEVIDGSDYQLTLPSGSTIGHRSLMRYYKQNLDPKKGMLVQKKVHQVLSSYQRSGYTPIQKEAAQRKARDIKFMQRAQQKFSCQVGCKSNKLQKHFRPQVDF